MNDDIKQLLIPVRDQLIEYKRGNVGIGQNRFADMIEKLESFIGKYQTEDATEKPCKAL